MKLNNHRYNFYEDTFEDEVEDVEEILLDDELMQICENLGVDFNISEREFTISISDNVEIVIIKTRNMIKDIITNILTNEVVCKANTKTLDNMCDEITTSILVIKEIKSKLYEYYL